MDQKHNRMKKLKVLAMMFCIAAMGLATSCSKEPKDLIVGKWEVTTIGGRTDKVPEGFIWNFSANETFSVSREGTSFNGTYYLVNDEKLTMTVDNDPITVTIEELSKSKMVWYSNDIEGKEWVLKKK